MATTLDIPMTTILVRNSRYTDMQYLQERLKNELGWEHKCMRCKSTEWCGKQITLHIDHINSVSNDNRIENLQFLCPNCDFQTKNERKRVRRNIQRFANR